ncbi:hypothetical protein [Actinomadura harenae]|uniref:Glycosyltransferase RgtA/B/C/D-like domain-containing protein n=1 Tax=Actinomadura harenae TaxID=2483351 RepID=A0A3M2LQI7_9ACTN|nr:hypothetical protein [Actinomadura harenae]RMI39647.1 hypothetical protein EBO15_29215 [Actinomadura harenae]
MKVDASARPPGSGRAAGKIEPGATARRHGPFALLLAVAVLARLVAMAGYPSTLWFGDSGAYLRGALDPAPSVLRPSGYSLLLWTLRPLHDFGAVAFTQHFFGLIVGVLPYLVVYRVASAARPHRTVLPGLLGCLAAAPVLLDAYQIQLEHIVLSDVLFEVLIAAAIAALLWRSAPSWPLALAAGLLLGGAAVTRTVGLPLVALALLLLIVRRVGWRTVGSLAAAFALVVGSYATWYHAENGRWGLSGTGGLFLFGRVAAFADCARIRPPVGERIFCRDWTHDTPGMDAAFAAMWGVHTPFQTFPGGAYDPDANSLAADFAQRAVLAQPLDYTWTVLEDAVRGFAPRRANRPTANTVAEYRFPAHYRRHGTTVKPSRRYGGVTARPRVVQPFARWIRAYQDLVFLPGPLLAALLLAALAGIVRRPRSPALLPLLAGVALIVVPAATADFDHRYLIPAVPLLSLAAVLPWVAGEGERADGGRPGDERPDRLRAAG